MARRLAAIMATDVVGYSCLIREDEAGTLTAIAASVSVPHGNARNLSRSDLVP